jgi:hypothetical protein
MGWSWSMVFHPEKLPHTHTLLAALSASLLPQVQRKTPVC